MTVKHPVPGRFIRTALHMAGLLLALAFAAPAMAHTDFTHQVAVDHALLRPANAGDNALLKLRIQNRGSSIVHLRGVEAPVASGSRIIFDDGEKRSRHLESIAIRPGDKLDLASSHMWIELLELTHSLSVGQHIPLRIVFAPNDWVDVMADVGSHHEH